jgi:hypothetical protein
VLSGRMLAYTAESWRTVNQLGQGGAHASIILNYRNGNGHLAIGHQ